MSGKIVGAVLTGLVTATLCAVPAIGEDSQPTPVAAHFPAPKDSDADGVLDASTTAAALAGAVDKDRPIEDLSQRTETFSTVANPDGTFTATDHSSPVRVKQGEAWVDIDPTLQKQADGSYRPKAASVDVRISGGGSKEAARVTFGSDESFTVAWPQELPTPAVDGPVATYRLSAATDLLVTATPSGVATHLRLNSPPSADDPAFTFGLATENLKVEQAAGGGLKVTDDDNAQVGTTSSLVAWDARTDAAGDIAKVVPLEATLSQARADGDHSNQTLNLQAPAGYLSDPKTVYPVIIDPDINAVTQVRDTYTRAGVTTPTGHVPYLMVGRESGSSNTNPARTLIQYETWTLAGKTITAASLNFYQYFGGSCSAKNVNIDPLTAGFSATTTIDTNRPTINTGTGASAVLSANRGPSCTDGSGFVSADVLSLAKLWAKGPSNGGLYNWGVQLDVPTANASDATYERRFCSMEPSTNTAIPCSTAARVPFMKFTYSDPAPVAPSKPEVSLNANGDATISTVVTGSRATALRARFSVTSGTTTVFDGYSAWVPGGDKASVVVPRLAVGTYTVKAWSNDGGQSSAVASITETFEVVYPGVAATPEVNAGENPATVTTSVSDATNHPVRVRLRVEQDGALVFEDVSSTKSLAGVDHSATLSVQLPALSEGTYAVTAQALDANGRAGRWSDPQLFSVDHPPGSSSVVLPSSVAHTTEDSSVLQPGESRLVPLVNVGKVPDDPTIDTLTGDLKVWGWTGSGSIQIVNHSTASQTGQALSFTQGTGNPVIGTSVETTIDLDMSGEVEVHNNSTGEVSVSFTPSSYFTIADSPNTEEDVEEAPSEEIGSEEMYLSPPPQLNEIGTFAVHPFTQKIDNPHWSETEPGVVHIHGGWKSSDPDAANKIARVTIQIQVLYGNKWKTVEVKTGEAKVGFVSSNGRRVTAREVCSSRAAYWWRGRVDVDVRGFVDTPGWTYSNEKPLSCKP